MYICVNLASYILSHIVVGETTFHACLEDVLKFLQKGVVHEVLHIEVCRWSSVMDNALRAASKKTFNPSKSLKVCDH